MMNNILLGLDLSEMDHSLVQAAISLHSQGLVKGKAILYHNIRYDFLGGSTQFSDGEIALLKKKIAKAIETRFAPDCRDAGLEFTILVHDKNSTTEALIAAAKAEQVGLFILGKKYELEGSGIIPQKLLTNDTKDIPVLLVPQDKGSFQLRRLMVAIDFSQSSAKLIKFADSIAQEAKSQLIGINVYQIPLSYFPYIDRPIDSLRENIKANSEKKIKEQLEALGLNSPGSWNIHVEQGSNIASTILQVTESYEPDLLMTGRLGKTRLPGNRMGGVTRRLTSMKLSCPVLIV